MQSKIHLGGAIAIALILITLIAKAQTSTPFDLTSPTKVYSPSDNAASFVQIKDLQVSFYTGTPQVSFELFTVKAGSLSHRIAINNSATAIRVEEEAGPIGLGWSFTAGGVITRSVVGNRDEAGSLAGYTGSAGFLNLPLYSTPNPTSWLGTLTNCNKKDLSEGKYELTPDIYNLSFDGRSAKMFFDRTGTAFFSPFQAWKVTGNATAGFIVTVEDGTRYEFGVAETSTHITDNNASDNSTTVSGNTAWYLSKIISNTRKDTIYFNYTLTGPFSQTEKIPGESRYNLMPGQPINPCGGGFAEQQKIVNDFSVHSFSPYMLSNVTYGTGKIDFVVTQDRTDTDGNNYRYREMNVYSKINGNYSQIRKFTFNQSNSNPSDTSVLQKRMLLNSFVEYGGADSVKHSFVYNTPDLLPEKNSMSQDHWGFFNGKNNTTLIPSFGENSSFFLSGANRNPDSDYVQIGLLKTITYPTGGSVTLDYEANDYSFEGLSSVYKPWRTDSLYRDTTLSVSTVGGTNIFKDTLVLTVPSNISASEVSVTYRITGPIPSDPPADVFIYNSSWTQIFGAGTSQGNTVPVTTVSFQPGQTYYLVVSRENSQYNAYFYANYNYWKKYSSPSILKYMAGGTRIKRITLYDGISHNNDQVKRFQYQLNDSVSSGHLYSIPKYEDYQYTPYYCNTVKGGDWMYFTRHASSVLPLIFTQGNPIGYEKVIVLHGENGGNGSEEFTYSVFKDDGGNGYPYVPQSSKEELRGLPLTHKVFTSTGSIVKSTTNEYNFNNTAGSPNYRWVWGAKYGTRKSNNTIINGCPDSNWDFMGFMYQVYQFWPTLKSVSDTTYDMNTGAKIGVKTNYTYDSTNLQLLQEDFVNSENQTVVTLYRYPKHFAGSAVYDSMIARNIINTVLEKTVTRGGIQSSKEKTNYGFFSGYIAPSSFQLVSGLGSVETRLLYYRYDNYGNLLEQGKTNDYRELYIWGYNNEYPVAKISGSTEAAVNAISLNNSILQNPSSDNALRTELAKLRNGLVGSSAQVTTYTYLPQIGPTTQTDPSGQVTYYEYDLMGRVKVIKDHDGKVLKTFEYKYQQPITQ
ncbi:hypothetical protein [Chitinophaga sp. CF418]|uniref:hypothetical protein n=1 Tax=Chitinophaga sp. CF418 TaxID=1855287 RepID=UPI000914289F|nr:hypothetical protein [Chitinophaga sp. CF418]SHN24996.1 YD repeat-containing protein [Chitinophaga sp. CF418]